MTDAYNWSEIEDRLRTVLISRRFDHTIGVTYTACALAMCHGADLTQARIAGLLHDCAKYVPEDNMIRLLKDRGEKPSVHETEYPGLLHARAGAILAETDYGVTDPDVLSAIRWHTTGRPQMTLLEEIIYVADYIEPHRYKAPGLLEIRRLAFSDLDLCTFRIMDSTVRYLESSHPKATDPMTARARDHYGSLLKDRS